MVAMALQRRQSVQYQEAHLYQDKTMDLTAFYIVLLIISTTAMVMRVISRKIKQSSLELDDWFYLAGALLGQGSFIVLLVYSCDAGLGKHWVALTPDEKALFPKLNYAYNILNVTSFPVIKISILLLYHRIFVTKRFRHLCVLGLIFMAAVCTSNTLVSIFACTPVRKFWEPTLPGSCIDSVKFYIATAVLNIITDIYILVLPMTPVWKLHTTVRRKIAISLIFMLGGLTFILGILRIVYYFDYTITDPSYSFLRSAYATPAEICLAIVVASAPTWRPLWHRTRQSTSDLYRRLTLSGSSSADETKRNGSVGVSVAEERRKSSHTVFDPDVTTDDEKATRVEGLQTV